MDGISYSRFSPPRVFFPLHTRGSCSTVWPLPGACNPTTTELLQATSCGCQSRFCSLLPVVWNSHDALLHISIGSATYGSSRSGLNSIQSEFQLRSNKHMLRMQQLNSYKHGESLDLESQILSFMNQSDRPDLFPSQSELLRAGRSDLVEGILAKGGWMVAGWDVDPSIEYQAQGHDGSGITKAHIEDHTKVLNGAIEDFKDGAPAVLREELGLLPENTKSIRPHHSISMLERQKGWKKVADLFGLSIVTKPEHDEKPLVLANQEIPSTQPNGLNGSSARVQQGDIFDSRGSENARQLLSDNTLWENKITLGVVEKKKKKRRRQKALKTSSADLNDQHTSAPTYNEARITQSKARCLKSDNHQQNEENDMPMSHRIRGLEAELISTLGILKSGRHTLTEDIKLKETNSLFFSELEGVSDALEFCETEIMNKKRELRTARAQQIAFEGKLALELMEFRRSMEEKENRLEHAMEILRTLRTARIVWPNPASEVFLAGSYDGWSSWVVFYQTLTPSLLVLLGLAYFICMQDKVFGLTDLGLGISGSFHKRMEKCSAGVFVATLQLYPGQYEIKFIVDGVWRVDPNRPRTHTSGHENNVLTIV